MKLLTQRTYICPHCGYNTTAFHHLPCYCCGSYKIFKERIIETHLSWNMDGGDNIYFPYIKIRKVVRAPIACLLYSYYDLAESFRLYRSIEKSCRKDDGRFMLVDDYRYMCRNILVMLRAIKNNDTKKSNIKSLKS